MRTLGTIVAGLLAGAAAWWIFQAIVQPPRGDAPPPAAEFQELDRKLKQSTESQRLLDEELEHMRGVLARLASDVRALREELQGTAPPPLQPSPAEIWSDAVEGAPHMEGFSDPDGAADSFETVEQEWAKERERENLARLEHHNAVHEQEGAHPYWARETTQKITDSFLGVDLPASQITDIDCRATRCRVVILHTDRAAQQEFQLALADPAGMSSRVPPSATSRLMTAAWRP